MWRSIVLLCLVVAAATGCTHRQLARSTVLTAGTVMDIQYGMVLTNLAMLSRHPEGLPSHIDIDDGVIQISDELGFGTAGGFSTIPSFGLERWGPMGRRVASEQWGADAKLDPQRITDLQDLYRVALGLQPLPPPNGIAFLRQIQAGQDNSPSSNGDAIDTGKASAGEGLGPRRVPIEILLSDVPPPGWFQVGAKRDVPRNACYVGCFGDRYAWVTAEGVPELARFTITILSVVQLKPGEPRQRGLVFTR